MEINLDLRFDSGSVLIYDKDETIFSLACDKLNHDEEFELILENPSKYMYAFISLYSSLIPDLPGVKNEREDYHFWLEYELLRRVNELSNTSGENKATELEDYETIRARRDDLLVRVRSQVAHMEKVKHKIPIIKRRQKFLWENYPLPYLTNTGNMFSLHLILRDRYSVLNISGKKLPFYRGFTEFSIPFFESFDIFDHNFMTLTNKNPNLKRRNHVLKSVELDEDIIGNYHRSQFLLFLQKRKNMGKGIELSRVEFFDLLSNIYNYSPHRILEFHLKGRQEKRRSTHIKGNSIEMILIRENNVSLQFKIPVELLQSMNKVIPYVKNVKFQQSYLGLIIHAECEGFSMIKTYIPNSSYFLYTTLYEKYRYLNRNKKYILNENFLSLGKLDNKLLDTISSNILQMIYEGKIGYNYENNGIFLNSTYDFPLQLSINTSAFEIGKLIGGNIRKSRYQYKLEVNGHKIVVKLGNELSWQCTCGKNCIYLVALLIILLEDKYFE